MPKQFGPYEVIGPLGAGGMGEVYRARDPRLGREVAVKVLPPEAVKDGERRRRFETEARAASALNHPNIVSVFDVGVEDGTPYLVTELVQGESLRDILRRGALSLKKLLDVAAQVADGLAAAHRAGIVHRDIKPENLMMMPEGRVKILDFGLARTGVAAAPDLPTLTQAGVVMGTVAYMSPEQARGEIADYRCDQFSLGLVLYEMAAGKRAFERPTSVETMTAILNDDPPPLETPAPLRWIVARCLAKEPGMRYAATADLAADLRNLCERAAEISVSAAAPVSTGRRKFPLAVAAICLVLGAAIAILAARLLPRPEPAPLRYRPFAAETEAERAPAWSPDGKTLAYLRETNGVMQVFTKALTADTAAQITRSPASCTSLFWAPDGKRIYYIAGGSLWSVGSAGGPSQTAIADVNFAAVSPDGRTIAFTRGQVGSLTLWMRTEGSPALERYAAGALQQPLWVASGLAYSRDGKTLALVGGVQEEAPRAVWLLPVAGGTPRQAWDLPRGAAEQAAISWMPDGRHIIVSFRTPGVSGDRLLNLDTSTGKVAPVAVGIGLERWPAVSPDGTKIAFTAGQIDYDLVEIPLDGGHAKMLLATSFHEADPDWSGDGAQLALSRNAAGWGQEVWLFNPQGGASRQLTGTAADSIGERMRPKLSPDGGRVAYEQFAAGHTIWISTIAGGQPVRLEEESNDQHVAAWSPDGAWIAYRRQLKGSWEIAKAPSGGGGKPVRLAPTKLVGPASGVVWSRDGRWIGFGDVDGIRLISPEGTDLRLLNPMKTPIFDFSRDNRTMLALARDPEGWWELHELDLKTGADKHLGRVDLPRYSPLQGFSLHPDGKRFATGAGTSREDIWILEGVSP